MTESFDHAIVALFCGSRHWTDATPIEADITALPRDTIVLHGGARGADSLAGEIAVELGLIVAIVPAPWNSYGSSAGPLRNAAMLRLGPELVYAYDMGGPGTASMLKLARKAGLAIHHRKPKP